MHWERGRCCECRARRSRLSSLAISAAASARNSGLRHCLNSEIPMSSKVRCGLCTGHFAILGKVSEQAAMATDCAGEQGKFWEYHDRLFADQGLLTQSKLKQEAQAMALKTDEFNRCLANEKYRKKIENEAAVGAFLGA